MTHSICQIQLEVKQNHHVTVFGVAPEVRQICSGCCHALSMAAN